MIIADVDIFYKGYFSRMPVSKAYNDMEQLRNMGTDAVVDLKMILGRKNSGIVECLYLIPMAWDASSYFSAILFRCGSAFSYAVFSANILFLWLILVFLVNSLSKSVKQ